MISLFLSVLSLVWFIFGLAMFILVLHPLVTFMILVLVILVYTTKWFLLQGTHLVQLLISSTTPSAPTPPPPRSPSLSSLLPSCPICLGTMKPPLKIFNCKNGHIICSSCKKRDSICFCRSKYRGKATAMEQMVGKILSLQETLDKD